MVSTATELSGPCCIGCHFSCSWDIDVANEAGITSRGFEYTEDVEDPRCPPMERHYKVLSGKIMLVVEPVYVR